MRKLFLIVLCVLVSVVNVSANDLLKKAEVAYDNRKYEEAIRHYEKLIAEGYKAHQLYFNLGNAYYRDNQLGKAIYNYELALKMEPNDEDVRINLGIAAAKTIDKVDSKENFFISAVKTNVLHSLTTHAWAWLSITCAVLACVLFFVFVNSGRLLVKRLGLLFSLLFFIGFFITYFIGYSALKSRYENKFAIILAKEIRVVNEPTAFGKTKFNLHEGTKIKVVEKNGDWVLLKLDNGNEGWVRLNEVGII
jgi:tetratricopeptide (TPR) repeat protein